MTVTPLKPTLPLRTTHKQTAWYGRPRPVIIRFHRFQIKELVIPKARKRGELLYNGHKIRLYDDYSPDLLKQRRGSAQKARRPTGKVPGMPDGQPALG
uniref:Uncharacterized protein n=1 Tax=Sander lucioperca TaxID=283035 RepID=A0A8C9ZSQ5_SANLU